MERSIRPASRENTLETQEVGLAWNIRRYLANQGYKVGGMSTETIIRRLKQNYSGSKIVKDGKTRNELAKEKDHPDG